MKTNITLSLVVVAVLFFASCTKQTTPDIMDTPQPQEPKAGDTWTVDGIEFVWIPPGSFIMGSGMPAEETEAKYGGWAKAYEDEYPQHDVTISKGFWMGKYEVTNAQYRKYKSKHISKDFKGHSMNGDSQPVQYVSWNDATAYCGWLSGRSSGTYKLPTEAEWEYACRAGTSTVRYWGDDDSSMGRYENVYDRTGKAESNFPWDAAETTDGHKVTAPVGSFNANAWGLHDMIGNVYEWCSDWYGEYSSASTTDPKGPGSGSSRVFRGGSWGSSAGGCRSATRGRGNPAGPSGFHGFRICRSANE